MTELQMPESKKKEILRVFNLQKQNHHQVRTTTYQQRKVKLKKLLEAVYSESSEIEKAVYNDFKKPASEVKLTEIYPLVKEIKHALRHLKEWMEPEEVYPPITFIGSKNRIIYEPKGVALIISPWNYPVLLALNPMVAAIAAGNCVILKPSERTPHTSAILKKIVSNVFDEEEVTVLEGGKKTAETLLALPFDHIFYTGGGEVGKIVMKAAADNLASVTLELGGKSPVIIDKTVDLRDAATNIMWGKLLNAGQTCIAPDYALIHESKLEKFIAEIKNAIHRFYGDDAMMQESPDYCHIVSAPHFAKISELVKDAVRRGAKIEIGNNSSSKEKFISPTVLSNVDMNSQIMKEEIFGPVLPVITYKEKGDILNIVEANPKPLAMYIFSKSKSFIKEMTVSIPAGGVTVNGVITHFTNSNLPFGGVNKSGMGKYHGHHGFKTFSNEKAFMKLPKYHSLKLLYPPYNSFVKKIIDFTVKYL